MPDHVHLIINPLECDISLILRKLKGKSAKLILDQLKAKDSRLLERLKLKTAGRQYAIWLKGFSSIDLWSEKFIIQKLGYLHANPVRAELCTHPAEWNWSSCRAYLPHEAGDVPIEMDMGGYWTAEELSGVGGQARL